MDEDVPLVHVSLLYMENHFYPLSDTDVEEDAMRIVATLPLLGARPLPPQLDDY